MERGGASRRRRKEKGSRRKIRGFLRGLLKSLAVFVVIVGTFGFALDLQEALKLFEQGNTSGQEVLKVLRRNNDVVNRLAHQGKLSNATYQAIQKDFAQFNKRVADEAARYVGCLNTSQLSNKDFSPRTDSDFILISMDPDKPVTPEQIEKAIEKYNELMNAELETAGVKYTKKLDTDLMADPTGVTREEFEKIARLNNDAYRRPKAATAEAKMRIYEKRMKEYRESGSIGEPPEGPGLTSEEIEAYQDEMNDFIRKKKVKIEQLQKRMKKGGVSDKELKILESDVTLARQQQAKYRTRLKTINGYEKGNGILEGTGESTLSKEAANRSIDKEGMTKEKASIKNRDKAAVSSELDDHLTGRVNTESALNKARRALKLSGTERKRVIEKASEIASRLPPGKQGEFIQKIAKLGDPDLTREIVEQMRKINTSGSREAFVRRLAAVESRAARLELVRARRAALKPGSIEAKTLREIENIGSKKEGNKFLTLLLKSPNGKKLLIGIVGAVGGSYLLKNMHNAWADRHHQWELSDAAFTLMDFVPGGMSFKRAVTNGVDAKTVFSFVKEALYFSPAWPLVLVGDVAVMSVDIHAAMHVQLANTTLIDMLVYGGEYTEDHRFIRLKLPGRAPIGKERLPVFFFSYTGKIVVPMFDRRWMYRLSNLKRVSNEVLDYSFLESDPVTQQLKLAVQQQLDSIRKTISLSDFVQEQGGYFSGIFEYEKWKNGFRSICEKSPTRWCRVFNLLKVQMIKRRDFVMKNIMIPYLIREAEKKHALLVAGSHPPVEELAQIQKKLESLRGKPLGIDLVKRVEKNANRQAKLLKESRETMEKTVLKKGEYWREAVKSYRMIYTEYSRLLKSISRKLHLPREKVARNILHFPWSGYYEKDAENAEKSLTGFALGERKVWQDLTRIKGSAPDPGAEAIDRHAVEILATVVFRWRRALDRVGETGKPVDKSRKFAAEYKKAVKKVEELYRKKGRFQDLVSKSASIRFGKLHLERPDTFSLLLHGKRLKKMKAKDLLRIRWHASYGDFGSDGKGFEVNFVTKHLLTVTVEATIWNRRTPEMRAKLSVNVPVIVPRDLFHLTMRPAHPQSGESIRVDVRMPDYYINRYRFHYEWESENCRVENIDRDHTVVVVPKSGKCTVSVSVFVEDENGKWVQLSSNGISFRIERKNDEAIRRENGKRTEASIERSVEKEKGDMADQSSTISFGGVGGKSGKGETGTAQKVPGRVGNRETPINKGGVNDNDGEHKNASDSGGWKTELRHAVDAMQCNQAEEILNRVVKAGTSGYEAHEYYRGLIRRKVWNWFKKDVPRYMANRYSTLRKQSPPDEMMEIFRTKPVSEAERKANKICREKIQPFLKKYSYGAKERREFEALFSGEIHRSEGNADALCRIMKSYLSQHEIPPDLILSDQYKNICSGKESKNRFAVRIVGGSMVTGADTLTLTAKTAGASGSVEYRWKGEHISPRGNRAIFAASKPGTYSVSVSVTDSQGNVATASTTITVIGLPDLSLSVSAGSVYYGQSADIKIEGEIAPEGETTKIVCEGKSGEKETIGPSAAIPTAGDQEDLPLPSGCREVRVKKSRYVFIWRSSMDGVEFDPPSGHTPRVKATFGNVGTAKIWAQVHSDDGKSGETGEVSVTVRAPKIKIVIDPENPKISEECMAKVVVTPEIDKKFLTFRWLPVGKQIQKLGEEDDGRIMKFRLRSDKLATLKVQMLAKSPYYGGELGSATARVAADAYKVNIKVLGPIGSKPMVWKEGRGLVEERRAIAVHQNVRMRAEVTPSPKGTLRYAWRLNADSHFTGGSSGSEVTVNRSQTGTCVATVIVKDRNNNILGKGSGTFSVTISQKDLNRAQKKAEVQSKAKREIEKARKLWKEGKIGRSLAAMKKAKRLVPEDHKIAREYTENRRLKKRLETLVRRAENGIARGKLEEAAQQLNEASKINGRYPGYQKALRRLEEAEKKRQKALAEKRRLEELLIRAKKRWESGDLSGAIAVLSPVVRQDPRNKEIRIEWQKMRRLKDREDALILQAEQRIRLESIPAAESLLRRAGGINARYPKYLDMLKKLGEARNRVRARRVGALNNRVEALWNSGKLSEAISVLGQASISLPQERSFIERLKTMQKEKKEIDKFVDLANRLISEKKLKASEAMLRQAGAINTRYSPYLRALERLRLEREAVAAVRKAEADKAAWAEKMKRILQRNKREATRHQSESRRTRSRSEKEAWADKMRTILNKGQAHTVPRSTQRQKIYSHAAQAPRNALPAPTAIRTCPRQFTRTLSKYFSHRKGGKSYYMITDPRGEKMMACHYYTRTGRLFNETYYRNGVAHGVQRVYFPSGRVYIIQPWNHGKKDGEIKYFSEAGILTGCSYYSNGKFVRSCMAAGTGKQGVPQPPVRKKSVLPLSSSNEPEGKWHTSEGGMSLHRQGISVSGTYAQDDGRIIGKMRGDLLTGYWIENDSKEKCRSALQGSYHWGRIEFRFGSDRFDGKWGYCTKTPNRSWTGTRAK